MKFPLFESPIDYLATGILSEDYIKFIKDVRTAGTEIINEMSHRLVKWDESVQDASYVIALVIGSIDLVLNEIRFSRYGKMVILTNEDVVDEKDVDLIKNILHNNGFNYISESKFGLPFRHRERLNNDWFHHYFDYT